MAYFKVVENTSGVQEQVAPIVKLSRFLAFLRLSQPDFPLASLLIKPAAHDLRTKGHVLAQIECLAHFVKVLPDIRRVGEETRPVRVQSKRIGVGMARDVTCTSRIPVRPQWSVMRATILGRRDEPVDQPSTTDIPFLFVNYMVDVLAVLLNLVCHENTRDTTADGQDS